MNSYERVLKICQQNNLVLNHWIDDKRININVGSENNKYLEKEEIVYYFQIKRKGKTIFEYGVTVEDNIKGIPYLGSMTEEQQKPYYEKYIEIGVSYILSIFFEKWVKQIEIICL